jgi:hypothetical protein
MWCSMRRAFLGARLVGLRRVVRWCGVVEGEGDGGGDGDGVHN